MDIDGVLSESFRIYTRFFTRLVLLAGAVFLVLDLASVGLRELSGDSTFLALVFGVLAFAISLIGVFWLQGVLAHATVDLRDGRADVPVGELFQRARPYLPSVIGAGVLAGIGIAVGLVLFIVPGLYLITIWAVIVPVIVLEHRRIGESFTRSRELVRGSGWQVFGVLLILFLGTIIASLVIGSLFRVLLPDTIGLWLGSAVANAVVVPLVAVAVTVMYLRLAEARPA